MNFWLLAQTQPSSNIIDTIFNGVVTNPNAVILAVGLIVYLLGTRATQNELRESRKMLNEMQKSDGEQVTKTVDVAMKAIDKFDRLASSLDNMAQAQRDSGKDTLAGMSKLADAHIETTNKLVNRIVAMEDKRSEDEIYANEHQLRLIDETLRTHKEDVGALVGTILGEAAALHEATRRAFHSNNGLILEALRATPPPPLPATSEEGTDAKGI